MSYTVKDLLRLEVAPALGCTEPVAVALAAAAATSLLPNKKFDSLEIRLDPNVYKNGLAVSIPGTGGLSGLDLAAALGALGGAPQRKLEVLSTIDEDIVKAAELAVADGKIKVTLLKDIHGLHVEAIARSGDDQASCLIVTLHDNIVSLTLNNEGVESDLISIGCDDGKSGLEDLEDWLKTLTLRDLIVLAEQLDDEDFRFLKKGVDMNMQLAERGLKHGSGLGVGRTLERLVRQKLLKRDMIMAARILTSSASDARMAGVPLPAMSSGGSGNHGLTAVLTIWALRDYVEADEKTVLEAIGLAHIVTAYVKAHTGRLSAICGCSVAAGAGATAGVTYLLGGTDKHISGAIKNLLEDLSGIICDGAKAGCALKLATAAGTAVQAALFSLQGVSVHHTDGIIGLSSEDSMRNVGTLATQGMVETDRTILDIMLQKHFK